MTPAEDIKQDSAIEALEKLVVDNTTRAKDEALNFVLTGLGVHQIEALTSHTASICYRECIDLIKGIDNDG